MARFAGIFSFEDSACHTLLVSRERERERGWHFTDWCKFQELAVNKRDDSRSLHAINSKVLLQIIFLFPWKDWVSRPWFWLVAPKMERTMTADRWLPCLCILIFLSRWRLIMYTYSSPVLQGEPIWIINVSAECFLKRPPVVSSCWKVQLWQEKILSEVDFKTIWESCTDMLYAKLNHHHHRNLKG